MNQAEFSVILAKISRFYPRFYENQDAKQVNADWFPYFKDNSFQTVNRAVDACINTLHFPPTVADIKDQIVESYLQDKPTSIQAFQAISTAVSKSTDNTTAAEQFNALPPILRKLVGDPKTLREWKNVGAAAFQTVIMSAIRESYTELVKREAKYYAFPAELQRAETWRINAPEMAALPAPVKEMTMDEMIADRETKSNEYRERFGIKPNHAYDDRVAAFQAPITAEDLKRMEYAERKKDALLKKIGV